MEIILSKNNPVSVQGGEPLERVILNHCHFHNIPQDSGFRIKFQTPQLDTYERTITKKSWGMLNKNLVYNKPENIYCNVLVFELTDYDRDGTITINFDRV